MAGSIKLFQFFQKCHQTIGIYPLQPKQGQLSTNSIQTIFLICFAQFTFTTVAFLLFGAKSLFDYGFTACLLVSIANVIAVYLILIWQSQNTFAFIENCEEFIKKRSHSTAAYKESIEKIELFNKFFCLIFYTTIGLCVLLVIPYSFVRYYIFEMGEDSFYLLSPAWFPFYWKTPFGYLVAWLAQCSSYTTTASIYAQFVNLVFGSCWLFIFIAKDITQDVVTFNVDAKTTSDKDRIKLRKRFCDMVQVYSDAKICVTGFNQISKYSLFAFISCELLSLSTMLVTVQFELWADESNSLEIAYLILILIWFISFIFLLCEPGARMTNQFEEFKNELNRCDWFLLPMDLQQWFIVFLSDTQNPIKVLSYANIECERETLKKIFNKAFSYFMTLRKFKT